jgi:hypothetical protein
VRVKHDAPVRGAVSDGTVGDVHVVERADGLATDYLVQAAENRTAPEDRNVPV